DSQHFQMMYEPLVWVMFDTGPQPALAKSWSYDAATMTWTLKLNPDAKFSDGTKVTAQDVEWTLEKSVELVCPQINNLIPILADNNPINSVGMTNDQLLVYANPDPVGSGPYKLKERVANSHVIYELRSDYWGGKLEIDTVQHLWFATLESILLAIKSGDIDTVSTFNLPTAIPQLLGDPNITVFQVANNTTDSFFVNQRFEPWNLAVVRRAASLAINRLDIISYALNGWGSIPVMIERDVTFADVKANYEDIKWPGLAYTSQAARIAEANKMLDGVSGMTTIAGGDGTYRKYNGKLMEFKIECSTNIASSVTQAEQISLNLKDIGIKLNVTPTNSSTLVGKVSRQTSDATASGWQTYVFGRSYSPDYDYFAGQWQYASATDPLRFTRRSWIVGWSAFPQGEAIAKEFIQLQTMPEGDATRDALIKKTMKEFADELPAIPLDNRITPCLHRNDKYTGWVEDNGYLYHGQVMPMVAIYNIKNLKPIVK
ncbi:MAG: ABC transporter substrate-binding protein, partial [Chloroflexi bacterium]|nr:ABC transporter substrate-binding protein [Chloroflexota bacterium]